MSEFDGIEFSTRIAELLNEGLFSYDRLLSWVEYSESTNNVSTEALEEFQDLSQRIGLELIWAVRSYEKGTAAFEKKRFDPHPVVEIARSVGESLSVMALVSSVDDLEGLPILSWDDLMDLYTDNVKKWLKQFVEPASFEEESEEAAV